VPGNGHSSIGQAGCQLTSQGHRFQERKLEIHRRSLIDNPRRGGPYGRRRDEVEQRYRLATQASIRPDELNYSTGTDILEHFGECPQRRLGSSGQ